MFYVAKQLKTNKNWKPQKFGGLDYISETKYGHAHK